MKKLSISILLLFVMILSITAVAAADDVTSDLAKSQTVDDSAALAVDGGADVLTGTNNFTTVQTLVDNSASTADIVSLNNGVYTREATDKAILVDHKVTIIGGTLDAANIGGIFNVTSTGTLILNGVTLTHGNATDGVIYNAGSLTLQNSTFTATTNKTTIYNVGTLDVQYVNSAIAFDGGSDSEIYNEGTVTSINQASFNKGIINNGTIEDITGATFAADALINNYGTINNITAATTAIPTINNNGTITSMKGKYTTVTNNGYIGLINGTMTTLTNNGNIIAIIGDVTTLTNNGTILGIGNGTVTTVSNNGTITIIDNVTATGEFRNELNATIYGITNLKSTYTFRNYANILYIGNSTFNYLNLYADSIVGDIENVNITNNLNIQGTVGSVAKATAIDLNVYNNATLGSIEDSTLTGAATVYANATVGTIDNVTVAGAVTNNGDIDEIADSTFKSTFTNAGNLGTLINANVTGYLANTGNITEIDDSVFNNFIVNTGNIFLGIENVTVAGDFDNYGNISDIEEITIKGYAKNHEDAIIDSIENVTFAQPFTNKGLIGEIENAIFNGTVTNDGTIDLIDLANFKGAVTNNGNLTVVEGIFLAVSVNNNAGNMYVYESLFNASNIVNSGNLLVDESALFNNTAVQAINNNGNLTVFDTYFVNNTAPYGAAIYNGASANATVVDSVFYNNTCEGLGGAIRSNGFLGVSGSIFENNKAGSNGGAIFIGAGIAEVDDSDFINNTGADGNAIYNMANLTLSDNLINTTHADIVNAGQGFVTAIVVNVLNNDTVYNFAEDVVLSAKVTDVDGNLIKDYTAFRFFINGTKLTTQPTYNATSGVYSLSVNLKNLNDANITNADQTVSAVLGDKYVNVTSTINNGTLKTIKGSFKELQYLINTAQVDTTYRVDLPYNFTYNPAFDNVTGLLINGTPVDIYGHGYSISGAGESAIFFINTTFGANIIDNVTFTNGVDYNVNITDGAAIYLLQGAVVVKDSKFVNNVASGKGGAIYAADGDVTLTNVVFTNNVAADGNAIYMNKGALDLANITASKTTADIVLSKNATLDVVTLNVTVLENKTLNITYGELVTLTAVITDENGNLINDPSFLFVVNNEKIPAIYNEGKYAFESNMFLKPGLYEVSVKYNNTGAPTITGKNGTLNVSKEAVAIVIFAKDVVVGQNATIELMAFGFNGDDLNNTNVTVTVNNVPYNVTITNGTGNLTLPVLDLGTYHVYANWAGDENHNASSQVAEFGVKIATVMTISATNAGYDSALIKVTLTDGAGNKLSKFVKVYVADGVYEVAVKNGEGTQLVTGLKPGAYIAVAEFSNDAEYADASNQTTFTVQPAQIVAVDMKRGWNSPYDYYATLLDAKGNPVAGKEITFTIDGVTYKATTNASGIAAVAAKLDVGTHTVTVTNPDTGANSTATATIVERIQGYGNITKDYLGPESYIVQVFGDDGNPVGENVVVEVRFAGKTYEMLTNASGYIVRTINFVPGFYAVYSVYAGYQTIQTAIVVNQILKVSAVTVKKSAKSFKLTATLKSSDGKAISGKEIKFTFAGKTYKAKTNSNGVATYKLGSAVIKKLKAGKKYTYKATYVNDIVKGKITVKK